MVRIVFLFLFSAVVFCSCFVVSRHLILRPLHLRYRFCGDVWCGPLLFALSSIIVLILGR